MAKKPVKHTKVTTEFTIITPEQSLAIAAEQGISPADLNTRPRQMIATYAEDMAALRWLLNGDAIIFDVNGKLIDGRKRLFACIEAGVGFPTLVVRGVPEEAAEMIDQHKRRMGADVLYVAGYELAGRTAATSMAIVDIARRGVPGIQIMPHKTVLRFVESEPGVAEIAKETVRHPLNQYYSTSDLTALLYLTRRVDREQSDKFFADLEHAIANPDSKNKSPVYHLARALSAIYEDMKIGGASGTMNTRAHQVVYTTKTWNAVRNQAPITRLKYNNQNEEPPRLNGLPEDIFEQYLATADHRDAGEPDIQPPVTDVAHHKGVTAAIETITPKKALEMLILNGPMNAQGEHRNRQHSKVVVESYHRDIVYARWILTGQSIKVSETGRLIDGQHRLLACVKSGKSFDTVVVRGLKDEVFVSFDTGYKHSFAHVADKRGVQYATTVQGAIRFMWQWLEYGLNANAMMPTMAELLNIFEDYPEVEEHARWARSGSLMLLSATPASVAGLRLILMQLDPKNAVPFFDQLESGVGLQEGMPVLDLRRRLIKEAANKRIQISQSMKMRLICLGWKAYVEGTKLKLPKDLTNVVFPEPFGSPGKLILNKSTAAAEPAPATPSAPKAEAKPKASKATKKATGQNEVHDLFTAPAPAAPKSSLRPKVRTET